MSTLTEYAKHRGTSKVAVHKAVKSGRLKASVTRDAHGTPSITDFDLADREWSQNTRKKIDQPKSPARKKKQKRRKGTTRGSDEMGEEPPDYETSRNWREAHAARREGALADMAEIEVSEKLDELVPEAEVRAYIDDKFAIIKTKLLGIPSRVAQQLPAAAEQVPLIVDRFIREALEELAAVDDGDDSDDD